MDSKMAMGTKIHLLRKLTPRTFFLAANGTIVYYDQLENLYILLQILHPKPPMQNFHQLQEQIHCCYLG
jgi:hypothetical protein